LSWLKQGYTEKQEVPQKLPWLKGGNSKSLEKTKKKKKISRIKNSTGTAFYLTKQNTEKIQAQPSSSLKILRDRHV